jgi:hypothetical protein
MTANSNPGYQGVALWLHDEKQHRRDMARTINNNLLGKINVTLDKTLPTSSTQTTLTDPRIGITTAILFMPMTSDAAQLLDKGIWVDTIQSGSAVIHYSNTGGQADLTFRLVLIG